MREENVEDSGMGASCKLRRWKLKFLLIDKYIDKYNTMESIPSFKSGCKRFNNDLIYGYALGGSGVRPKRLA